MTPIHPNRREFLRQSSLAALSLSVLRAQETKFVVAETSFGKVRGVDNAGIKTFKGIPYGANTAGVNRFMPPVDPPKWAGVRDALEYGHSAPQRDPAAQPAGGGLGVAAQGLPAEGEDCLVLNVWTPAVNDGRKRPVMFWCHGGGFATGSGSSPDTDGTNLARRGDVVVVTVNHRLNVLGFANLSEFSRDFAASGDNGMLDIVHALKWVRANIGHFGGDPNTVMIFGQSGGGRKVETLLAMPSAKGLFHRAIIQSGANLQGVSAADAAKSAQMLMTKLNVKTAAELQRVPMDQLVQATLSTPGLRLSPVLDGKSLPEGPFTPAAPAMSAEIPVLIGSTEFEVNFFPNTNFNPIDDAALRAAVRQATRTGDADVDKLVAVYRKGRPGYSNVELQQVIASDNFRAGVMTEAERKSAQKAPVYMYYFTWRSPVRDGKLKAFHTLEIPFVLENVDEGKSMTGTGQDRYALQEQMSGAWAAFARNGNPNHKGLPHWSAFNTDTRATMIFGNECKAANDPYGAERSALASLRSA